MPTPDAERFRRVETLYHEALEHPPTARAAFLAASDADPAVRAEVEALLGLRDRAESAMGTALLAGTASAVEPEATGRRIGPYRLVRRIGAGGMGSVWLAEREGEFEQRVAVKLIRAGADSDEIVGRFLAERQVLAGLDHPNVARLLDGGRAADGRPYLVMEHVDGVPIDAYCAERRLSVADRVRLFLKVCAAVQAAHQNLVVHRDLKPGNILVTPEGEPKLLDFGIAKVLAPGAGRPDVTATQVRRLTPQYASPEQVRGEMVSTASDVYSLGVVLYELLTGTRPYDLATAPPEEHARIICEAEPPRPSTAVSTTATAGAADGTRAGDSRTVVRRLRGDLDTIVLMALRKEPARRYATVGQLADDLRRFLDGHPVTARPDTFGYRASKFIARHKGPVAAATTTVLVALAALVIIAILLVRSESARKDAVAARADAVRQQQAAEAARARAESEADMAEAVSEFLTDMLAAPNPWQVESVRTDMREVRVIELLDAAARDAGPRFADRPDVEASIRATLGRTYQSLEALDEAQGQLERALELQRATLPADDPRLLLTRQLLAKLRSDRGDAAGAERLLAELEADCVRVLGPRDPETISVKSRRSTALRRLRRYEEAHALAAETLDLRREVLGADHPDTVTAMIGLATLENLVGRPAEAEAILADVVEERRRAHGDDHRLTLNARMSHATQVGRRGRTDEARAALEAVVTDGLRVLGPDDLVVLDAQAQLGLLLQRSGAFADAAPVLADLLERRRRVLGDDHPRTLVTMTALGGTRARLGAVDEGEALLLEALERRRRVLGAAHRQTLVTMDTLAGVYAQHGRPDEATALLREALAVQERTLGPDHPDTLHTLNGLASVAYMAGRYAEAVPVYDDALARLRPVGDEATLAVGLALRGRGSCLLKLERHDEAEAALLEAHAVLSQSVGNHPQTRRTAERLVELYEAWDRPADAERWRGSVGQ
jgi:serine/threonine-protein kinase